MENSKFATKIGVVMAAAGSAVGLGNIWRFPYLTGENGGGAFLLVYIVCVLLVGLPVMLSEFVIGRRSGKNAMGAMRALSGSHRWDWLGWSCVACSVLILAFYVVVTGWCVRHLLLSLFGAAPPDMVNTLIALAVNAAVLWMGVQKGIERMSRWLMPLLLVLLLLLVLRSFTLQGSMDGLRFLFRPDWGKITGDVWLSALSQAFFSLSIGLGCMLTYAAYMRKDQNMPRTALQVAGIDTLVAIVAGVAVFPAVFSFGFSPAEGPQLVFSVLPSVFAAMPWGGVLAVCFFFLLLIAAITSSVSIQEIAVAYLGEQHGVSRNKSLILTTVIAVILTVACSLSLDGAFQIAGRSLFDWFDFLTSKFLMPLGGMGFVLFLGWFYPSEGSRDELQQGSRLPHWLFLCWLWAIRIPVPVAIFIIFLHGLGIM